MGWKACFPSQSPGYAIGIYTNTHKFRTCLQQLMAGSRNFRLSVISCDDQTALTLEAAEVSGIDYVMSARYDEVMGLCLTKALTEPIVFFCYGELSLVFFLWAFTGLVPESFAITPGS